MQQRHMRDVLTEHGNATSMSVRDLVLKQRAEILNALCSSGFSEHLERVLDIMLAQGELVWEDYQNIQVSGRALYTNARQLLDLVSAKGAESCGVFLSALKQVLPELQGVGLSPAAGCGSPEGNKDRQGASSQTLLIQRPSLVSQLQGCVDGALDALVASGHFTSSDCDEVRLPIHSPSQQVSTAAAVAELEHPHIVKILMTSYDTSLGNAVCLLRLSLKRDFSFL